MNGCFSNDTPLRQLLSSWKCQILAVHIEEEGIDIEELEMMKTEHMTELLRNYRLGIRIRFEHYFEKWRLNINKPVVNMGANYMNAAPFRPTFNELQHRTENIQTFSSKSVNIGVNTDPIELNAIAISTLSPPSVITSENNTILEYEHSSKSVSIGVNTDAIKLNSISTSSPPPITISENNTMSAIHENIEKNIRNDVPEFVWFKKQKYVFGSSGYSILNILKLSDRFDILDFYEEYGTFSTKHRVDLVKVIAEYFVENNINLTMESCGDLERQVNYCFPNEQIIYYRNGKCNNFFKKYTEIKNQRDINIKSCESSVNCVNSEDNIRSASVLRDGEDSEDSNMSETISVVYDDFAQNSEDDNMNGSASVLCDGFAQNTESSYEPFEVLQVENKIYDEELYMNYIEIEESNIL